MSHRNRRVMPTRFALCLFLAASCLAGCTSLDDTSSSSRAGLSDVGSSIGGGFGRNTDTYGTNQRRMDLYGGTTAPVLPTIGAPGYGK